MEERQNNSSAYTSLSEQDTVSSSGDEKGEKIAVSSSSTVAPSLHAWVDIFATSKLVLCMAPRNLTNPHIMIQNAQKDFLLNFGYSEEQLPFPLSAIFGNSTERAKIVRLEQCLLTGRSFSEFINLHKSNGGSLSCYISLLCLTNQQPPQALQPLQLLHSASVQSGSEIVKYGILTIRSASVVGNSKYSGIGLMGTDRVPHERIQELPTRSSSAYAGKSSAAHSSVP